MVINLDGSGLRKLLADPPRPVNMDGEWSPDGKWIVYEAFDPDLRPSSQVYVTDAQGLNSFQIARRYRSKHGQALLVSRQQAYRLYGRQTRCKTALG